MASGVAGNVELNTFHKFTLNIMQQQKWTLLPWLGGHQIREMIVDG